MSGIDSYLFDLTDKLAFLSLEEASLEGFGVIPTDDFAVPVFVTDIRALADGQEGFSTKQIATAMLYILGIDENFRFNDIYKFILNKIIDKPEAFAVELGMDKYSVKSYKEALIFLRAAMLLNKKELYPVFNYAQIALEFSANTNDSRLSKDLFEEAKTAFEAAIRLDPDHAGANFQLGQIFLQMGKAERAVAYLEIAAQYGEEDVRRDAQTLLNEGLAAVMLEEAEADIEGGNYLLAVELLEKLDLSNLHPALKYQILYAKGFAYKGLGNIEEALEHYGQALQINNQDSLLLAELGMSYALLGDFEQALELYLAANDLEKDSAPLLNNISIIYLNLGNIPKAKEYIHQAKALQSDEEIVDETIKLIRSIEEQGS